MDKTSVGMEESVEQSSGGVLFFEKLQKIHRKIPVPESLFNEVSVLEIYNVFKK